MVEDDEEIIQQIPVILLSTEANKVPVDQAPALGVDRQ